MDGVEQTFIGFGSNQGDSVLVCRQAIDALGSHPQIKVLKVSSLYRTKPVGEVEQDWFINGVLQCETSLDPAGLLQFLQRIEKEFGRVRTIHWGPRTLDLDILAYGLEKIESPELTVPHPLLHERLFVLVPLAEIAPGWTHPLLGSSARELLDHLLASDRTQEAKQLEAFS